MNKKSILRIVSVLLLMTFMVSGCGNDDSVSVRETENASEIEFSWWGNDPRHLYTMEGVDLFMQENPDITVDYRYGIWNGYENRNKVYMNSNREPDVMQINYAWISQYSPDGEGYYDLYQLADTIDLTGFTEVDLSFGEVNGKLNALPIAYNSTVIYYNQDAFNKYGLEIPKTWDDLFVAAKEMSADNIYPLGGVKKHVFLMLIAYYEQTMGNKAFNEDGKCLLTKEDIMMLLDFYKRLIDEKVLMPIDQYDRSKLSSGELAGSIFWISDISNYCSSIESAGTPVLGSYLTTDVNKPLTGWYKKPATMLAISDSTDYPEESARLLNFLLNDSRMAVLQGTEKGIPVSKYALEAIEKEGLLTGYSVDANNQMIEAGDDLQVMIPVLENEDIIDLFKTNSDDYIYNILTLEEVADNILEGYANLD